MSTVVAVHSSGMSSRQWRALAERLGGSHRVVMPDLLGSGANPPWPEDRPFHFRDDVAELARIVAGAQDPVHLVGHSYGGFLVMQLLLDPATRARVQSIAVYDPVAFGAIREPADPEALADLDRAAADPVFTADATGGQEPWFRAFVDYWNGAGAWDALPAPSRAQFVRVGRKVFGEVMSLMQDRTTAADYASFSGPALLLTGSRTPIAARRVAAALAAALPDARLEVVEGAGHMGPLTHAPVVNELIASHLAR